MVGRDRCTFPASSSSSAATASSDSASTLDRTTYIKWNWQMELANGIGVVGWH
jgi:hypothetical protein